METLGFIFGLFALFAAGNCMCRIKKLESKLKELEVLEAGYKGE